jgi:serine/threonine protein kinase/Tol biopolymer transport system component
MSMIGKTLAHYQITAEIGKGGMGEVYQAKDQKLGRDVAIKVLPEAFARDTERVARFQREAKILASLNHPNIAAIHGLEESDGTHFLVLELIEGQTLADRLKRAPIPVEEALKLGLQIAEALEAAHERGVIHRDLKPANIKITSDGKVKVLDFGLAKAYAGGPEDVNLSNSPTLSDAATQQGVILGTAAYMSPEQARGETVDKRADIWAFGIVLFEMLTGRQVFTGKTVSDTLASVLAREPQWQNLPPNLHTRIRFLLEHCLKKEPKDRYSGISDARVDIQEVLADPSGVFVQPNAITKPKKKLPVSISWVAAVFFLGLIIAGVAVWMLRPTEPRRVMRFDYHLPEDQQFNWNQRGEVPLAVSPDGSHFVYGTTEGLYIRAVDELDARLIPGTDGNSRSPFFSTDGNWLGYMSVEENKLKKIAISGGAPVVLCDTQSLLGASWNTDNTIVYGAFRQGIMRVSADAGIPEMLIETEGTISFGPQLLPDGKSVLFGRLSGGVPKVVVHSLKSGETTELFDGDFIRYLPTGHIVYWLDNNLFTVPFDLDRFEVAGGAVPKVEGVTNVAVSEAGTLVYIPGAILSSSGVGRTLVWTDRKEKIEELNASPNNYIFPKISPDGTRVALTVQDTGSGNYDIWVWDLKRETLTRLTTDEGMDIQPIWTPDSKRIVFGTNRDSEYGSIYWRAADGTGKDELLFSAPDLTVFPYSWSSDGKILVMGENTGTLLAPSNNWDIGILSMEGEHERTPLLHDACAEVQPQVSPDGQWIAYCSDVSGQPEVYVRPFPDVDKGQSQVSTNGGRSPRWSPAGRELLFLNNENELMTVSFKTEPAFSLGTPEVLFESNFVSDQASEGTVWDIHPDGERFLMMRRPGTVSEEDSSGLSRKIVIVTNWFEELKQ